MFGDSPFDLLVAYPHSETTLSIVGNTGVAIIVVTACLAAVAAFPRLSRLAGPVMAVGSMSLTGYVFHIVAIGFLDTDDMIVRREYLLPGFIVSITVFAVVWSRFFRKGPLDWLIGPGDPARPAYPVTCSNVVAARLSPHGAPWSTVSAGSAGGSWRCGLLGVDVDPSRPPSPVVARFRRAAGGVERTSRVVRPADAAREVRMP